jgi:hypothetical protein
MQHFQAWDNVIANTGDFEGKAGVVQGFDKESGIVTVKFDEVAEPQMIQSDELKRIG